jgi:hypothetical protein
MVGKMTEIILSDMEEKILNVYKNRLVSNFYSKQNGDKTDLFLTISYENKIIHKEYLESYNSREELEKSITALQGQFFIEYKGDLVD